MLAGPVHRKVTKYAVDGELAELSLLAKTAGVKVVDTVVSLRSTINPATFMGSGKIHEIKEIASNQNVGTVIFDVDLSPAQADNIQKATKLKVIDRSGLILDIFAQRARTKEAKIQVELAQLRYLLPRLTRMWVHLSRQEGGIGLRGPGETQIEVDRRRIRSRIAHLEKELGKIEKIRHESRKARKGLFNVTLVGYTNAGKSTLLNAITCSNVATEDLLFKTLDSTTRMVYYPEGLKVLFNDTVGFIEKLPHHLIASFKSTLEEIREADLFIHVVDANHSRWENQMLAANKVLGEMDVLDIPTITVFNKIDLPGYSELKDRLIERFPEALLISALKKEGIDLLKKRVAQKAFENTVVLTLNLDHNDGEHLSLLYQTGTILDLSEDDSSMMVTVRMDRKKALSYGFMED